MHTYKFIRKYFTCKTEHIKLTYFLLTIMINKAWVKLVNVQVTKCAIVHVSLQVELCSLNLFCYSMIPIIGDRGQEDCLILNVYRLASIEKVCFIQDTSVGFTFCEIKRTGMTCLPTLNETIYLVTFWEKYALWPFHSIAYDTDNSKLGSS